MVTISTLDVMQYFVAYSNEIPKVVEGEIEEFNFEHLPSSAFQYIPLGRTILGPANNIKRITKMDLKKYIQRHYAALRMVIVVFGAIKHEEVVDQVKKLFTKLSSNAVTVSQQVVHGPITFIGFEAMLGSWSKNIGGEKYMGSDLAVKQLSAMEISNDFARFAKAIRIRSVLDVELWGIYEGLAMAWILGVT
ncbi:hypothetical protein V6N12_045454 [Hibiscus sabdariffa]|uniref:Peptidase M16 C-terminal domain-containing protein n=1 Tax=Hibiscus sabdariffa TaxID=183260 RepID=A0ABR2G2S5_9ROSI